MLQRPATADGSTLAIAIAATTVLLFLVPQLWMPSALESGGLRAAFVGDLWLSGTLLAVGTLWAFARALRAAAPGSGAGLLLAAYGLWARAAAAFVLAYLGPIELGAWDAHLGSALGLSAVLRDVGAVAFGLGIGLVARATIQDVRRRRHGTLREVARVTPRLVTMDAEEALAALPTARRDRLLAARRSARLSTWRLRVVLWVLCALALFLACRAIDAWNTSWERWAM